MSETPSEAPESTQTSRNPIYQKDTTGSYWGDVKEAINASLVYFLVSVHFRANPHLLK